MEAQGPGGLERSPPAQMWLHRSSAALLTTPSGPQQAVQLAPVRSGYGSPRQPLGHLEFSTLLGIY